MKAVRFHEFGGPEVLKYEDVPEPEMRKDEVLIRVKACALNHLDLWIRKGLPGVTLPHINGSDVSGDVVKVGEYIKDIKEGQRVLLAPMNFCGHCQQCRTGHTRDEETDSRHHRLDKARTEDAINDAADRVAGNFEQVHAALAANALDACR